MNLCRNFSLVILLRLENFVPLHLYLVSFSHYIFLFALVSVKAESSVKLENCLCYANLASTLRGILGWKSCPCNFHMLTWGGSRVIHVPSSLRYRRFLMMSSWAKTLDKNMIYLRQKKKKGKPYERKKISFIESTNWNLTYIFLVFFNMTKLKTWSWYWTCKRIYSTFSASHRTAHYHLVLLIAFFK